MAADSGAMRNHPIVSHEEWLVARRALLEKEKAFTRQGDELSRLQRDLPWGSSASWRSTRNGWAGASSGCPRVGRI
jgi:predicted dithiol-disulfide oxidoreductase (DUF899 family)